MNASNLWVTQMTRWLADWRAEAAQHYEHKLGTIIIFGNTMESIDAPSIRIGRSFNNDNRAT